MDTNSTYTPYLVRNVYPPRSYRMGFEDDRNAGSADRAAGQLSDDAARAHFRDEYNANAADVYRLAIAANRAAHDAHDLIRAAIAAGINADDERATDATARHTSAHIATVAAIAARDEAERIYTAAAAAYKAQEA